MTPLRSLSLVKAMKFKKLFAVAVKRYLAALTLEALDLSMLT